MKKRIEVRVLQAILWVGMLAVLAALVLLNTGCQPFEPSGGTPYAAPDVYREWWQRDELCSGRTGNFDRIRWFSEPGITFATPKGPAIGWWNPHHEITIATNWLDNEVVVRHEMLHDLLNSGGHWQPEWHTCRLATGDTLP